MLLPYFFVGDSITACVHHTRKGFFPTFWLAIRHRKRAHLQILCLDMGDIEKYHCSDHRGIMANIILKVSPRTDHFQGDLLWEVNLPLLGSIGT